MWRCLVMSQGTVLFRFCLAVSQGLVKLGHIKSQGRVPMGDVTSQGAVKSSIVLLSYVSR